MTDKLIPFMREIVNRTMPFNQLISFIHMKQLPDGTLMAKSSASDGTVHLTSISNEPIDIEGAGLCLGNLPFLNQLLNSEFMKGNDAKAELNIRERNEKRLVTMIKFTMTNRAETTYTTTDPFRRSIIKPMQIEVDDWPIDFVIDATSLKEIGEYKKIHAMSPSVGTEDIVMVTYAPDAGIGLQFGEGGGAHTSTLDLDTPVESTTSRTISLMLQTDQFLRALMQSQDEDKMIGVEMAKEAIQLTGPTNLAIHQITLAQRIVRRD